MIVDPNPDTVHICDRCGYPVDDRQCKIICPNCGCMRDCSDP